MKKRLMKRSVALTLLVATALGLALLQPAKAQTDDVFASYNAVSKSSYNDDLYTEAPQDALPLGEAFRYATSAIGTKYGVAEDALYGRSLSYGYCDLALACQHFPFWQFDIEPNESGLGYHVLVNAQTGVVLCLQRTDELVGLDMAKDMLTEVYGWYTEELADFRFETTGVDIVLCWQRTHPNWVYSFNFNIPNYGGCQTPFQTDFPGYPGEGGAREVLRELGNLLADWTQENRAALVQLCDSFGVALPETQRNAILNGDILGAEVVRLVFESCYGDEQYWNDCHREWLEELMAENAGLAR